MWRSLLVILCLLLAGCSSPTTEPGTPVDAREVTAAPVPDDEVLLPGVTDEGVVVPRALANAHAEVLAGRSYTLRTNRSVRYPNGTLREQLTVNLRLTADRSYLVETTTRGPAAPVFIGRPPAKATYWSNGSTYLRKLTRDDQTTYNRFDPVAGAGTWQYWARTVPFGGQRASARSFIAQTFSAVPARTVAAESVDGQRRYRLVGREARTPIEAGVTNPRNTTLRATVTEAGLVRSLSLSYEGRIDDQRVHITRHVRYEEVNATRVERPDWADRVD